MRKLVSMTAVAIAAVTLTACDTVSHAKFVDMLHGRGGSAKEADQCYQRRGRDTQDFRCPYAHENHYHADFSGGF